MILCKRRSWASEGESSEKSKCGSGECILLTLSQVWTLFWKAAWMGQVSTICQSRDFLPVSMSQRRLSQTLPSPSARGQHVRQILIHSSSGITTEELAMGTIKRSKSWWDKERTDCSRSSHFPLTFGFLAAKKHGTWAKDNCKWIKGCCCQQLGQTGG